MPLPDANNYSMRIYELLKETDLENLSYAQFQAVAEKLFIEPENEDEMRRLVLVQLARMAVRGDWDGFLSGSTGTIGGSTTEDLIAFGAASADTITKDAGIAVVTKGGGASSVIKVGGINIGGSYVSANTTNGVVALRCDGAGQIFLNSGSEYGGTYTNTIVNVMKNTLSDTNQLKFRDTVNENNASLTETSGELNVKSNVDAKDITLETKTTGLVRVKNQTTNTDTQLNVQGNGTGTPKINLSNDTKAVTIQCDETQKLKVIGGSDDFIFDVSSATGGITFPDGTVQNTAASSSTNNFDVSIPAVMPALANTRFIISQIPPWGSADVSQTSNGSVGNKPMCFPFISPKSGDVSEIGINITSSAASGNIYVALYDSDTDGYADSLLGYATLAATSTGSIYQTSLSATPTLVRGRQYWYSFNVDSAIAPFYMAASTETVAGIGTGSDVTQNAVCFYNAAVTAYAAPPASFTSSYSYGGYNRPVCSLKIS